MSYLERWKATNRPTVRGPCMHCGASIELPKVAGTSLIECPHCRELQFKSIDRDGHLTLVGPQMLNMRTAQ